MTNPAVSSKSFCLDRVGFDCRGIFFSISHWVSYIPLVLVIETWDSDNGESTQDTQAFLGVECRLHDRSHQTATLPVTQDHNTQILKRPSPESESRDANMLVRLEGAKL